MQPNKQLLAVFDTLRGQPGVTAGDIANLTGTIVSNPYLLAQFNQAAASGALKRFDFSVAVGAQASYSGDGTISLSLADIASPPRGHFGPATYSSGSIVFLLGHEIHHANDPALRKAWDRFHDEVAAIARDPAAVHDYTGALTRLLDARRAGEGGAEIAGFNAVHAAVVAGGRVPTGRGLFDYAAVEIARYLRDPFGDPPDYRLNPALQTRPDGSLAMSATNVTVANHLHFHADDRGSRPDYTHRYAVWPLVAIGDAEAAAARSGRPARIVVDFAFFGFDEGELRRAAHDAGLDLPRQPIHDSPTDRTPHRLGEAAPAPSVERPLLAQAREAVARLDAGLGRAGDEASERLGTAMAALAGANGFSRIDHVVVNEPTPTARAGERVFVVEGALDSPHRRMAAMDMRDALDPAAPDRLARQAPAGDVPAAPGPERAPALARA